MMSARIKPQDTLEDFKISSGFYLSTLRQRNKPEKPDQSPLAHQEFKAVDVLYSMTGKSINYHHQVVRNLNRLIKITDEVSASGIPLRVVNNSHKDESNTCGCRTLVFYFSLATENPCEAAKIFLKSYIDKLKKNITNYPGYIREIYISESTWVSESDGHIDSVVFVMEDKAAYKLCKIRAINLNKLVNNEWISITYQNSNEIKFSICPRKTQVEEDNFASCFMQMPTLRKIINDMKLKVNSMSLLELAFLFLFFSYQKNEALEKAYKVIINIDPDETKTLKRKRDDSTEIKRGFLSKKMTPATAITLSPFIKNFTNTTAKITMFPKKIAEDLKTDTEVINILADQVASKIIEISGQSITEQSRWAMKIKTELTYMQNNSHLPIIGLIKEIDDIEKKYLEIRAVAQSIANSVTDKKFGVNNIEDTRTFISILHGCSSSLPSCIERP